MQIVYCGTVYGDKEALPAAAFELLRNPDASRMDVHLRREVSVTEPSFRRSYNLTC